MQPEILLPHGVRLNQHHQIRSCVQSILPVVIQNPRCRVQHASLRREIVFSLIVRVVYHQQIDAVPAVIAKRTQNAFIQHARLESEVARVENAVEYVEGGCIGVGCFVPIKQRKQKHAGAGTVVRIDHIDSNKASLECGIAYVFV